MTYQYFADTHFFRWISARLLQESKRECPPIVLLLMIQRNYRLISSLRLVMMTIPWLYLYYILNSSFHLDLILVADNLFSYLFDDTHHPPAGILCCWFMWVSFSCLSWMMLYTRRSSYKHCRNCPPQLNFRATPSDSPHPFHLCLLMMFVFRVDIMFFKSESLEVSSLFSSLVMMKSRKK